METIVPHLNVTIGVEVAVIMAVGCVAAITTWIGDRAIGVMMTKAGVEIDSIIEIVTTTAIVMNPKAATDMIATTEIIVGMIGKMNEKLLHLLLPRMAASKVLVILKKIGTRNWLITASHHQQRPPLNGAIRDLNPSPRKNPVWIPKKIGMKSWWNTK